MNNFSFKCDCSMVTRALGDGCDICNTELSIDQMLTPVEVADELINNAFFTDDQGNHIAEEVYQPLLLTIKTLNNKIDQLVKHINKSE